MQERGWESNAARIRDRNLKWDTVDSDVIVPGPFSMASTHSTEMSHSPSSTTSGKKNVLSASWREWLMHSSELEFMKRSNGSDWELGSGSFGTVYKAMRAGVQPVAVKVLRDPTEKQLSAFAREVSILQGLRDHNVVQFLGVCYSKGRVMLVTEFMQGGDLWNALATQKSGRLNWYARGRQIGLDVARGLVHLHSKNVVHLDLKSPNILLARDTTAKIADVGLARSVTSDVACLSQMTAMGTIAWAAPELLRNFRIGIEQHRAVTHKADVFSFGVVLWEVVTGEDPQHSSRNVKVPSECPKQVAELIAACVQDDPSKRPDMRSVYEALKFAANLPDPRPPEEQGIDRVGSAYTTSDTTSSTQTVDRSGTATVGPVSAPLLHSKSFGDDA